MTLTKIVITNFCKQLRNLPLMFFSRINMMQDLSKTAGNTWKHWSGSQKFEIFIILRTGFFSGLSRHYPQEILKTEIFYLWTDVISKIWNFKTIPIFNLWLVLLRGLFLRQRFCVRDILSCSPFFWPWPWSLRWQQRFVRKMTLFLIF